MALKSLGKCIYCPSDLFYEDGSTLIKCQNCGETMAVAAFLNQEVLLEKAQQEAAESKKAQKAAEQEKDAALKEKETAEKRVFDVITRFEDLTLSQDEQKEYLEKLLDGQNSSKEEAKGLRQLLRAVYGNQEMHQDALTELLSAVLREQETAGDKLKTLQEISEKILQSRDDIVSLTQSLSQYLKTDKKETSRLLDQMWKWSQNADQETTRRLESLQTGSKTLQNSLKNIENKIDKLDSKVKDISNQINQQESSRKQSELKRVSDLYHQAENKQKCRDFDMAEKYYRDVLVSKDGKDPEVYWRLIMCHYCVEYQQDDQGKWLPTILYPSLDDPRNLPDWHDLQKSCENASDLMDHYEKLLAPIEQIVRSYCEFRQTVASQVFICVKQEENDRSTDDSIIASDLYDQIRDNGLDVFNSRRTQMPAGEMFEPYIIAALLSAKLMIVVGTTPDHMKSRWVKNEWSRYQWLQDKERRQNGKTDRKLVCYLRGMKPKDIPDELHPDIQAIVESTTSAKSLENLLKNTFPTSEMKHDSPSEDDSFELICDQMEIWLAIGDYDEANKRYRALVNRHKFISEPRLHLYALCAIKMVPDFDQLSALNICLEKEQLFNLARKKAAADTDRKLIEDLLRANREANNPPSNPPKDPPPNPPQDSPKDPPRTPPPEKEPDTPPQKAESDKVRQLRIKAENGDAVSQFYLARCYDTGDGVEQSYKEAFNWYQIAAAAGNAAAQCNLGCYYDSGHGVEQNYEKAVFWFQKSADQGDNCGQNNLGVMYENGRGIPKNLSKAAEWYQKSADQGYAPAQYSLGRFYENGLGVKQDYARAQEWYKKAADQGNESAKTNLKNFVQKMNELKQEHKPEPPVRHKPEPPAIKSIEIESRDGRLDHYLENNHLNKEWIRDLNWPDTMVLINDFVSRLSFRASYEKPLEGKKEEIIWQILTEDGKPFTSEIHESRTIQSGIVQHSLCWWQYTGVKKWPQGVYSIVITVNGSAPFIQHFRVAGLNELRRPEKPPAKDQKPKKEPKPDGAYSNPKTGYEKEFVADSGAARKWTVPPQTTEKQKPQSTFSLNSIHIYEANNQYAGITLSDLFIQKTVTQLGIHFDITPVTQPEYAVVKWKVLRQDGYVLIPESESRLTLKKGDKWIRMTRRLADINQFIAGAYHATASCNGKELTTAFTVVDPLAAKWNKGKEQIKSVKLLVQNTGSENDAVALSLSRSKVKQIGVRMNFKKPSAGSEMLISWCIERDDGEPILGRINSIAKIPKGAEYIDRKITPGDSTLKGLRNGDYKIRVFVNGERPLIESFTVKE